MKSIIRCKFVRSDCDSYVLMSRSKLEEAGVGYEKSQTQVQSVGWNVR